MKSRSLSERFLFIVLATGAMYLGSCPASWAEPEGMTSVEVLCDSHLAGLAAPVSASSAVTAAHVIDGCVTLGWRTTFKTGRFLPLTRDEKADWVLLLSEGQTFDHWYSIAKAQPKNGDRLWWYVILPGEPPTIVPVSGTFLAEAKSDDGTGDPPGTRLMYVDGSFYPGSSGSPFANDAGALVGIGKGWWFRAPASAPTRALARAVPIRLVFK